MAKKKNEEPEVVETTVMPQPGQAIVQQAAGGMSTLSILSDAVNSKADVEVIERLLAARAQEEAREAKKAYAHALVTFRSQCPVIIETGVRDDTKVANRDGKFGTVKYTYPELAATDKQIGSLLAQCKLAPTYRISRNEPNWVEVVCVLTHVLGHSEESPYGAPPNQPNRGQTAVQARNGTVTTLKRIALFAALGLVSEKDIDLDGDDGNGGDKPGEPAKDAARNLPQDPEAYERFAEVVKEMIGATKPPTKTFLRNICGQAMGLCGSKDLKVATKWLKEKGTITDGVVTVRTDAGQAGDEEVATDGTEPEPAHEFEWWCSTCEVGFDDDLCPECGKRIDREPWLNHVLGS